MTKRILDHNPLTGTTTYFEFDSSEQMHITEVQDVTSILDVAAAARAETDYSRQGIKNDHWHYARIPDVIGMDMLNRFGVNMYAPKPDWKRILHLINTEYPAFKMTNGHHAA